MEMHPVTLCVTSQNRNAERPWRHSHAERGNDRLEYAWLFLDQSPPPIPAYTSLPIPPGPALPTIKSRGGTWSGNKSTIPSVMRCCRRSWRRFPWW
ncbi:hypothetical protein CVG87_18235 [Pseudomonas sp. WCS365]|nr:hypothetical protein CVG87_18235 [Pseudomonas sp. WCS365]